MLKNSHKSVVDPGFPRGGAVIYYLANFPRKLHENEENLAHANEWSFAVENISFHIQKSTTHLRYKTLFYHLKSEIAI